MNRNAVARKLIRLLNRRAALMGQLAKVDQQQCELLQSCMGEAGLDPEIVALGVAPKEPTRR